MPHTTKLIYWLIALLAIAVILYFGSSFLNGGKFNTEIRFPDLSEIQKAEISGDNQSALAQYQLIKNDPTKTPSEKAIAAIQIAGISFDLSGDVSARTEEIQRMKNIFMDTTLSAATRAAALSVLGMKYNASGKDESVFSEIYRDAPFSDYLVADDPVLSALKLQQASYEMSPSSGAAIYVARLATDIVFNDPKLSTDEKTSYVGLAEDYLKKADATAIQEASRNSLNPNGERYILYRAMRAVTIGRLAIVKGDPYTKNYRQEFDDFIAFAMSKKSTFANDQILTVRFQYARILERNKDVEAEKEQLDLLGQALSALTNPDTRPFVLFLRNERSNSPTGPVWVSIQDMFKVSPDFKAAVNKFVVS